MRHTVTTKTLSNGIDVLFIDIPDVTTFDFIVGCNSGYRFATKDDASKYEVPHVLEHLMFDGSKKYPSSDELQDIFQASGGMSNGVTNAYLNFFPFRTRVSRAKEVMAAALDMVFFPLLTKKSFDEEMSVIQNELSDDLNDFATGAEMYTVQQVLPDLLMSVDTQLERLPNVVYEDISKYFKKYFVTNNTTIIVAADFKELSQKDIEKSILEATKDAPKGKKHEFPMFDVEPSTHRTKFVDIHKTVNDSVASVQFSVKGKATLEQRMSMQMLSWIACSMKSFSVAYKLRKKGLIYGLNFAYAESIETYGLELDIATTNDKFVEVFAYTLAEVRDYIASGLTDEQFKRSKEEFLHFVEDGLNSADDIVGWYLIDYLQDRSTYGFAEYQKAIQSITQKDMLELATKLFSYDNAYATVFSAKGIRASTAMDTFIKEILVNKKEVTTAFIEEYATSLSNKDNAYKGTMGAFLSVAMIAVLVPFTGVFHHPTVSQLLIDSFSGIVAYSVLTVWLLVILAVHNGTLLRSSFAWTASILAVLSVALLFFDADKATAIFTSTDMAVRLHGCIAMALIVAMAVAALALYGKHRLFHRSTKKS